MIRNCLNLDKFKFSRKHLIRKLTPTEGDVIVAEQEKKIIQCMCDELKAKEIVLFHLSPAKSQGL